MAASYRSIASNSYSNVNTSTTSLDTSAPSGTQSGDILLAIQSIKNAGTSAAPSGWTKLGTNTSDNFAIYWKRVSGTEGTTTWTWGANVAYFVNICVVAITGAVASGTPIDASSIHDNSAVANSVVPTVSGDLLVCAFTQSGNWTIGLGDPTDASFNPPSGFTEVYDNYSTGLSSGTNAAGECLEVCYKALGSTAATGNQTATDSGSLIGDNSAAAQIAVTAAPVPKNKSTVRSQARARASRW